MPPRTEQVEIQQPHEVLGRVQRILGERFDMAAYDSRLGALLDSDGPQSGAADMASLEWQLQFDGLPEGFAPHFYKRAIDDSQGGIRPTATQLLDQFDGRPVFDKREDTHPYVRSFKARGALFDVLRTLSERPGVRTFTANSTGNHGRGVVAAVNMLNRALVESGAVRVDGHGEVAPEDAAQLFRAVIYCNRGLENEKRQALVDGDAEVRATYDTLDQGGKAARGAAERDPLHVAYIDPYDTDSIIAGQATLGMELLLDLAAQGVDLRARPVTLRVAVGGGGLYAGQVAVFERAIAKGLLHPGSRVVAVEAKNNDSTNRELHDYPPLLPHTINTVAGGIATLRAGRRGFAVVQAYSPDGVRVPDEGHMLRAAHMLAVAHDGVPPEFAGTLSLASLLQDSDEMRLPQDSGVEVTVTCGGNASAALLYEVALEGLAHEDARVHTAAVHLGPAVFKIISNDALQPRPQPVVVSEEAFGPVRQYIPVANFIQPSGRAVSKIPVRGLMNAVSRPFV
ncbi:MAG TPA: pyridoxal-phosphate dependent enzyme [Bacillota bacterium]|nr:pyridoxal-phosphate dependent enzyme [Bacillota bacterium]